MFLWEWFSGILNYLGKLWPIFYSISDFKTEYNRFTFKFTGLYKKSGKLVFLGLDNEVNYLNFFFFNLIFFKIAFPIQSK